MAKTEDRVTKLENTLERHLEESGIIRTDLSWLKRAFWMLAGTGLTFNITLAGAILAYLLRK